jgi:hypothetical protein
MDIPAMSMALSQNNLSQAVGVSVLNLAKDASIQQSQDMVQLIQQSVQPSLGRNLDIRV